MSRNSWRNDFRAFVLKKWIENPNLKKSELPKLFRAEGGRIRDSYARRIYREVFSDIERYGKGRASDLVDRRRVAFEVYARERLAQEPKLSARKLRSEFRSFGLSISNDTANEIVRLVKDAGKAYAKITRLKYVPMVLAGRNYSRKYAYIVSYLYQPTGSYIWEKGYITIMSDTMLTPKQIIDRSVEILAENVHGEYPIDIDYFSLTIESAFFKEV